MIRLLSSKRGAVDTRTIFIILGVIATIFFINRSQQGADGPSLVQWRTDFASAVRESASSGKPLLLDFTATWCPPCQQMKKDVWNDEQVAQQANTQFIPVLIDVDDQPALAEQFGIDGYPTIKIFKDEKEIYSRGAYHSASQMRKVLSSIAQ